MTVHIFNGLTSPSLYMNKQFQTDSIRDTGSLQKRFVVMKTRKLCNHGDLLSSTTFSYHNFKSFQILFAVKYTHIFKSFGRKTYKFSYSIFN